MANNYDVNYEDERFAQVESDKEQALTEMEQTYAGMIQDTDKHYQQQIDASKQWAEQQSRLQQEQNDFAVEQIEQQKEQAKKGYLKEQSGAYADWRKQSNQYGPEAEKMASSGLANTGYSESAQVSMYNTYQNRVASARESYNTAVQNYNNAITEARLQNNAALAEIAYEALQTQLELSLQSFQYKNQLLLDKANQKTAIENTYYSRYQDVLSQINSENALAEQIRQYNEQMAEEKRQYDESMAFQREQYEYQKAQDAASRKGSGKGSGGDGDLTLDDDMTLEEKLRALGLTDAQIAALLGEEEAPAAKPTTVSKPTRIYALEDIQQMIGTGKAQLTRDNKGNITVKSPYLSNGTTPHWRFGRG